uniref:EOG090X01W2 n=1 Tax=Moina brachiata TaxID=675436 RepID=A0A4Y7NI28_9CRUS|nr:EOG090X01W2 [Moina brachiata]SVE92868.1 EOG090X01W2 [Moina brachiata]
MTSSPSPSSLDSVGTSPLGSFSDSNEHPLLARDLGLGPLVGYGENGVFSGMNNSTFTSSVLHNSTLSLYLNGLNSNASLDSTSALKDNLSMGSSGTSSRPPSGGLPGCNSSTSSSGVSSPGLATKCAVCGVGDSYSVLPKVLPCLHALCQMCWDKQQLGDESLDKGNCPVCKADCLLSPPSHQAPSSNGSSMFKDFTSTLQMLDTPASTPMSESNGWSSTVCTGCKSKEPVLAVAKCFDCASLLCTSCVLAHQFMHCFEGHRLMTLAEIASPSSSFPSSCKAPSRPCVRHRGETVSLYCHTCSTPACGQCLLVEHSGPSHDVECLNDAAPRLAHQLNRTLNDARTKAAELKTVIQATETAISKMSGQLSKAQTDVTETYHFYRAALDERREELLREIESVYNSKHATLSDLGQKTQEAVDRILKTCSFVERLVKQSSPVEALLFKKELDAKFAALFAFCPPDLNLQGSLDVEFMSNYKAIQIGVRNTYGYIRSAGETNSAFGSGAVNGANKQQQPPIARPTSMLLGTNYSLNNLSLNTGRLSPGGSLIAPQSNGDSHFMAKRFPNATSTNSFGLGLNDLGLGTPGLSQTPTYEKWSNNAGSGFDSFQMPPSVVRSNGLDTPSLSSITNDASLFDLSKLMSSSSLYPPRSQIKRQKMIYHCKFGEFGVMEGQFTEPSGVAVNAQNDIIVADTNNHRIQIFDKEGRFKFQFGECGKRDGQLLYPNRVSVVKTSGDIIVTERSPTHQIQIYNQYGQFARKFGANVLQHPRGVTVDSKGRIIVVECKVMRVIIFDQMGNVLHKFGCSKHLEFPNGVVVNDKQEIFISDNRAHCVKVFSYEGVFLRQIGGEGLTNYPIGVGINSAGEILIADNHNNFNLTIFTQDGQLISALESKVKHAQCFDVALLDDGSVVLASKDYRLYVYRYVQIPPLSL